MLWLFLLATAGAVLGVYSGIALRKNKLNKQ
jgi:hypothetical protein